MSAALAENDPDLALTLAEEASSPVRKYERRKTTRRTVVNLPDEMSFWLGQKDVQEALGVQNVPQALRVLATRALRSEGVTPSSMKVAYHTHLAALAAAEAEAEAGE